MICFDTSVLIWGVQGRARPGQADMVERTRKYIRHLSEKKQQIMVPSPVVQEYLRGFESPLLEEQARLIERSFFVPALDFRAAVLAAQLQPRRDAAPSERAEAIDRQSVRVDAQVVAIAIANHAEKIISGDPHLSKLAQGWIPVEDVPSIPEQMKLNYDEPHVAEDEPHE